MKYYTFALLLAVIILVAFTKATDKQDQIDCYTWQHQASSMPGFYLTQSEADQCSYWHIQVNAPVE